MRKLYISFAVIAIILGSCACLLAQNEDAGAAVKRTAILRAVSGEVEVKSSADNSEWVPATAGLAIAQGYSVRTGSGSSVTIDIYDGAEKITTELGSQSRLSVLEISYGSESGGSSVLFSLEAGKATAKTENMAKGSSFEIKTPTSIVSSQGPNSSFNVQVDRLE